MNTMSLQANSMDWRERRLDLISRATDDVQRTNKRVKHRRIALARPSVDPHYCIKENSIKNVTHISKSGSLTLARRFFAHSQTLASRNFSSKSYTSSIHKSLNSSNNIRFHCFNFKPKPNSQPPKRRARDDMKSTRMNFSGWWNSASYTMRARCLWLFRCWRGEPPARRDALNVFSRAHIFHFELELVCTRGGLWWKSSSCLA